MTDILTELPLTTAVFHILLALGRGEKHGYEIMKAVRCDSGGHIKMGNGTLYGSLKRMLAAGLVEDAGERAEGGDTRRKYYRLTERGREALAVETDRYLAVASVIHQHPASLQPEGAA